MTDRLQKQIDSIKEQISNNEAYEAHQKARTFIARYVMKKNYTSAYKMIVETAETLAQHNHFKSASDLAVYFIEIVEKSGETELNDDRIEDVANLLYCFDLENVELAKFINLVLQKSKSSEFAYGNPAIRYHIGNFYFSKNKFTEAIPHFIHSDSGKEVGDSLVKLYQSLDKAPLAGSVISKFDSELIKTIFECLALKYTIPASQALKIFKNKATDKDSQNLSDSTDICFNFLNLLTDSVQNLDFNKFRTVMQKYKSLYENLENGQKYFEKISQNNFNRSCSEPENVGSTNQGTMPNASRQNPSARANPMAAGNAPGGMPGMPDLGGMDMNDIMGMMNSPVGQKMMGMMPDLMSAMGGGSNSGAGGNPMADLLGGLGGSGGGSQGGNPLAGLDMGALAGMASNMMQNNPNLMNDIGAMFGGGAPGAGAAAGASSGGPGSGGASSQAPDFSNLVGMAQNLMQNNPDLMSNLGSMFGGMGGGAPAGASSSSNANPTPSGNAPRTDKYGRKEIPKNAGSGNDFGIADDDID